jgi:ferredoxin-NADP reductase
MEKHIVKVLKTQFVTYNVKLFTVERPAGYEFVSGQATDVSINKPGLENELRPFTFTNTNDQDHLEFTIKIYKSHAGVTAKLLEVNEGDELILHEVFGAIHYRGPGLFLAGGAGITPFISILRQLRLQGELAGNILFFANRTENDIIIRDELREMLGENYFDVLSEPIAHQPARFIDMKMLKEQVLKGIQLYYVCGPDKFIDIMVENLTALGIIKNQIILEA